MADSNKEKLPQIDTPEDTNEGLTVPPVTLRPSFLREFDPLYGNESESGLGSSLAQIADRDAAGEGSTTNDEFYSEEEIDLVELKGDESDTSVYYDGQDKENGDGTLEVYEEAESPYEDSTFTGDDDTDAEGAQGKSGSTLLRSKTFSKERSVKKKSTGKVDSYLKKQVSSEKAKSPEKSYLKKEVSPEKTKSPGKFNSYLKKQISLEKAKSPEKKAVKEKSPTSRFTSPKPKSSEVKGASAPSSPVLRTKQAQTPTRRSSIPTATSPKLRRASAPTLPVPKTEQGQSLELKRGSAPGSPEPKTERAESPTHKSLIPKPKSPEPKEGSAPPSPEPKVQSESYSAKTPPRVKIPAFMLISPEEPDTVFDTAERPSTPKEEYEFSRTRTFWTSLTTSPQESQESRIEITNEQENADEIANMTDYVEDINELKQNIAALKLQLNASQQEKTSLELQLRQKEEVIIKVQAEQLKNEQSYKTELKQLMEELRENTKSSDCCRKVQEELKEAKAREECAVMQLASIRQEELNTQKIMQEYEKTISARITDFEKLKKEHETATRHLANLEIAFSDIHAKYERTKTIIEGFKQNEDTLKENLKIQSNTIKQHEERYESLKAHAKMQLEKSNKEVRQMKDSYENESIKYKAIIKQLEIKCSSLSATAEQKTIECAALSALCEEVTGKKV